MRARTVRGAQQLEAVAQILCKTEEERELLQRVYDMGQVDGALKCAVAIVTGDDAPRDAGGAQE